MYDSNENRWGDRDDQFTQPPRRSTSPMGIASISCAIIGLFCIMTGIFALVFGSLAILFANLSKGSHAKVQRPVTYGRMVGCIAAVIGAIMIIYSFSAIYIQYGSFSNYYNTYIESMEENYGLDLDAYRFDTGE